MSRVDLREILAAAERRRELERAKAEGYKDAIDCLVHVVSAGMLDNDVDTVDKQTFSFLSGMAAAIGMLLEPLPADFQGLIDVGHASMLGFDHVSDHFRGVNVEVVEVVLDAED